MTALQRNANSILGAAALIVTGTFAPVFADAQVGGSGRMGPRYVQTPESRVLLITTFHSSDKKLGVEGTKYFVEAVRANIQAKELFVLPKEQIDEKLKASQYETDVPLNVIDAKSLGQQMRADEILEGRVENVAGGNIQYSGRIYLQRDLFLNEVLPMPAPGSPMRVAAKSFVESLREVRKQLPHEQTCANAVRDGKFAEAEAAARAGVAAYPKATIARTCLMRALAGAKKGPEATLAVAAEILAIDSLHRYALGYAVDGYLAKGDTNNYVRYASKLVAVDLGNATMVEGIVQTLAQMGRTEVAVQTVEKAIEASPLEAPLHRLRILLQVSAGQWNKVAAHSEELAKLDTAAVDSAFFVRLSVAYRNDSQPAKALEALQRAAHKFPRNAFFQVLLGQELARAGQHAEAITAYRKALELDPKLAQIRLFIASGFQQMNEGDSTIAWLRKAWEAKEDTTQIAGMAMVVARPLLQAAQQSKLQVDYEKVIPIIAFADSVAGSDQNKWLLAYSAYGIWGEAVKALQTAPTCDLARAAANYIPMTVAKIREGGHRAGGEPAIQIMNATGEAAQYAGAMVTQHCRGMP